MIAPAYCSAGGGAAASGGGGGQHEPSPGASQQDEAGAFFGAGRSLPSKSFLPAYNFFSFSFCACILTCVEIKFQASCDVVPVTWLAG